MRKLDDFFGWVALVALAALIVICLPIFISIIRAIFQ